jgi:putative transposase
MGHAYANNYVHCVFSTKNRAPLIRADLQTKLGEYLKGIGRNLDIPLIGVGGTDNHIHLLIRLPATMTLASAIQKLKANSSRWLDERRPGFEWQPGYGAFSVSPCNLAPVLTYIRRQPEHHVTRDFEEEFRAMLIKAGVTPDSPLPSPRPINPRPLCLCPPKIIRNAARRDWRRG